MVTIETFLELVARVGLTDAQVAAAAGLAPQTVRLCRIARELPERARCREAIAKFVAVNAGAKTRADVRFIP